MYTNQTKPTMKLATMTAVKNMITFDRHFHQSRIEMNGKMFDDKGMRAGYLASREYEKDTKHMVKLAKYAIEACEVAGLDPEEMIFSCVNFVNHHDE